MRASYRRLRHGGRVPGALVALLVAGGGQLDAQEPARLPEVEVQAARGLGGTGTLPLAVTLLDSLPAVATPATVAGLLRGVPGVVAIDQGNPAVDERLAIRGFGSRSAFGVRGVAVLLDGVPQTLPDGQGQLTDVDPLEPARIEVVRGGASALHGNAAGGVVSVRTALMDGATGWVLGGAVGGFGARQAALDGALRTGAVRIAAGASTARRDGWRDHSHGESLRLRLGLVAPVGGVQLQSFLRYTDQPDLENPGGLTAEELTTDPTAAAPANVAADAGKTIRQWQGAVRAVGEARGPTQWSATAFGGHRTVDNPLAFGTIGLDRTSGGLRLEGHHALTGATPARLTLGLDAQWMRDDRENTTPDGATVTLAQVDRVRGLAPFGLVRLQPGSAWLLSLGLRFDAVRFEVDDQLLVDGDASGQRTLDQLSPSLGVTRLLGDARAAWAGVRSSFETPTTTELVNRPDGSDGLSTELAPQRAWHAELGVRDVSAQLGWEVVAWAAWVQEMLVPFEDPSEPGRRFFRNAGSARLLGLEAGGRWRPRAWLGLTGSWALTSTEYTNFSVDGASYDGNALPGVPRQRATLSATGGSVEGLGGAVDLTASSGLWMDDANSARSDGWFTADLRLWWRGRDGLEPWLALRNALDAAYAPSVIVNAAGGRYYEPGAGRVVEVGLRWTGGR